jgi:hypothetical protein
MATQVLAWLSLKVRAARGALESQLSGMDSQERDLYVCGLLSEYLSPSWCVGLEQSQRCSCYT